MLPPQILVGSRRKNGGHETRPITSPIYPSGTEPSTKTLLGYETANYTFVGEGPDNRTDFDWRLRQKSSSALHPLKNELCVTNCLSLSLRPTFGCYL
jgi:hypothetical protein